MVQGGKNSGAGGRNLLPSAIEKGKEETMTGIKRYYEAQFQDTPCGHEHRSFGTAERCAEGIIRTALRGVVFGFPAPSRWIRDNYEIGDAAMSVASKTYGS